MEITGKIKLINDTETIGNNGFRKREIVITTEEQYPQHILVEFVQDKTDLLNNYQVGQNVKVIINLRGREWTNPQGEVKYFNSIQGWRIENVESNIQQAANKFDAAFPPAENINDNVEDDLPF